MTPYDPEQIEGTLSRIIFKNDNGFVIGSFIDQHNNTFSAYGTMVNPQIDMGYLFTGQWVDSPKYGKQFEFTSYETQMPLDPRGIFNYIVRICRFVGSSVGNALLDKYGEKTLHVLKTDPGKVAEDIRGITLVRAKEIQKTLLENEMSEQIMVQLEAILDVQGMRKSLAGILYAEFKSDAAEVVKSNPYIITNFAGIGFPLADRVALHNGIARDDIERKKAAAKFCLLQNMNNGSTWMRLKDLLHEIYALIQVHDIEAGVYSLIDDGDFTIHDDLIAFTHVARDEQHIAHKLVKIMQGDVA
jgi:exodeoxyribonuclease V alpha subunit